MNLKNAVTAIEKQGILLVFPISNRKQPSSLWSSFWPRSEMRWEWDSGGDNRVANLWHLREELSRSRKVVYAKWYQGRATFFSREIFTALLTVLDSASPRAETVHSASAGDALRALRMDSPLSTKQLKEATGLRGRAFEGDYQRALKELWSRLRIVGFGEIDDGAFPSLAVGATEILFEDLWEESKGMTIEEGWKTIRATLPEDSLFLKQLNKILNQKAAPTEFAPARSRVDRL